MNWCQKLGVCCFILVENWICNRVMNFVAGCRCCFVVDDWQLSSADCAVQLLKPCRNDVFCSEMLYYLWCFVAACSCVSSAELLQFFTVKFFYLALQRDSLCTLLDIGLYFIGAQNVITPCEVLTCSWWWCCWHCLSVNLSIRASLIVGWHWLKCQCIWHATWRWVTLSFAKTKV